MRHVGEHVALQEHKRHHLWVVIHTEHKARPAIWLRRILLTIRVHRFHRVVTVLHLLLEQEATRREEVIHLEGVSHHIHLEEVIHLAVEAHLPTVAVHLAADHLVAVLLEEDSLHKDPQAAVTLLVEVVHHLEVAVHLPVVPYRLECHFPLAKSSL